MSKLEELKAKVLAGFSFGGGNLIGLSIGTSAIKVVELKKSGKNFKLVHFGIIQLPDDSIVNREIVNSVAVTDSIKTLVGQVKLKGKDVCTAISGTGVIIKRMTVEAPKKTELQEQVFWEAEQYLPFDVNEVVMDYHTISRSKEGRTDVLLVAAKRSVLDLYMGAIQDAGLRPKIVDTDYFAMQTAFEVNYPGQLGEAVALVDIGAAAIKIVVVAAGVPVFNKDSSFGGRNLTADIQKHLGLSYADAEALKTSGEVNSLPQEVSDLMNVTCSNISTEVKRALDFYGASSSGSPVTQILLCGGSAKIPNLTKFVEEAVGLPAQILNPFQAVTYDPAVFTEEFVQAIAPIAAVPMGLAIRAGEK